MTFNVPNLNTLIALISAQPPERINMSTYTTGMLEPHVCGTSGCIAGWAIVAWNGALSPIHQAAIFFDAADYLGLSQGEACDLFKPSGFRDRSKYPAHRVIATLKRLRDHYLATGKIVVDWGPEPGAEPAGLPWSAPRVVAIDPPALPTELTRLLGQPADLAPTEG